MPETRKLAAILAADVAGYSKLAGADEERTLARLRVLRSDLFDPTIALHHGPSTERASAHRGFCRNARQACRQLGQAAPEQCIRRAIRLSALRPYTREYLRASLRAALPKA
jgi:class 3 adenylate cyclase